MLLIGDVDDIQAILQFSLETLAGWQVIATPSSLDWMAIAHKKKPDVILIDGLSHRGDILAQLKTSLFMQDVPVVCLVSRDRLIDQLQAKQAGVTAVVAKPFDPVALIQTISAIIKPVTTSF